MALYKTHLKFNLIIALPIFTLVFYFFFHVKLKYLITFIGSFIYVSYFLTPDADLSYKNKLCSLKGLLTFPFLLYSLIFHHRGISHVPIIGTLTRLAYLITLIFIVIYLLNLNNFDIVKTLTTYKGYFISGFLAIILSDLCHLLLDLKLKF